MTADDVEEPLGSGQLGPRTKPGQWVTSFTTDDTSNLSRVVVDGIGTQSSIARVRFRRSLTCSWLQNLSANLSPSFVF
jgi:hypothetical protein